MYTKKSSCYLQTTEEPSSLKTHSQHRVIYDPFDLDFTKDEVYQQTEPHFTTLLLKMSFSLHLLLLMIIDQN